MSKNKQYRISQFRVKKLWGYKNITLKFFDDINIIIGPNASGKTTLINLLQYILTGNIKNIAAHNFEELVLQLSSFNDDSTKKISVTRNKDELKVKVSTKTFSFPLHIYRYRGSKGSAIEEIPAEYFNRHFDFSNLRNAIDGLVPGIWLPVSRRLPISEEEDDERRIRKRSILESVDECLSELTSKLQQYRMTIESELSKSREEFQRHALENILYDKKHDKFQGPDNFSKPSDDEKQQLIDAFKDIGLLDDEMQNRINEHFKEASTALDILSRDDSIKNIDDLLIIPLINRTKSIVQFAQQLKNTREDIFKPLKLYENTVNSFFNNKLIKVSERGLLEIESVTQKKQDLNVKNLSSGEKQILILLTQALLKEKEPVVYIADEPELSLHVSWQEKLLSSLLQLAGRCQLIVATHSPDIVSDYVDKIIDLDRV